MHGKNIQGTGNRPIGVGENRKGKSKGPGKNIDGWRSNQETGLRNDV